MVLSSVTSYPLEEVAKALGTPPWYQLYMPRKWDDTEQLVKRVEAFFHGVGVPFNRGAVARRICEEINRMRSTDHLPTSSKPKVEALIAAINKALE